jgi:GxxExxY protein
MRKMELEVDEITQGIIGAAIEVHKELGPGLLESAYQACLDYELVQRGLSVQSQVQLPVVYQDVTLDCGYRLDFLVEDRVIVELKSVDELDRLHEAQLLSYLKLARKKIGLLINFNVQQLIKGVRRRVL